MGRSDGLGPITPALADGRSPELDDDAQANERTSSDLGEPRAPGELSCPAGTALEPLEAEPAVVVGHARHDPPAVQLPRDDVVLELRKLGRTGHDLPAMELGSLVAPGRGGADRSWSPLLEDRHG